jgi:hypothetical protein
VLIGTGNVRQRILRTFELFLNSLKGGRMAVKCFNPVCEVVMFQQTESGYCCSTCSWQVEKPDLNVNVGHVTEYFKHDNACYDRQRAMLEHLLRNVQIDVVACLN